MVNEEIANTVNETKVFWFGVHRAEVGQQIRHVMRTNGIKGKDLAERMGMQESEISKILNNDRKNLKLDTLYRFADALEVPLKIEFDVASTKPFVLLDDLRKMTMQEVSLLLASE